MQPEQPESQLDRIAHDLKNQLGIILGFAELFLAECASDDPRRAELVEMEKAATAAVALVNQLSWGAPEPRDDR